MRYGVKWPCSKSNQRPIDWLEHAGQIDVIYTNCNNNTLTSLLRHISHNNVVTCGDYRHAYAKTTVTTLHGKVTTVIVVLPRLSQCCLQLHVRQHVSNVAVARTALISRKFVTLALIHTSMLRILNNLNIYQEKMIQLHCSWT